MKENNLKDIFQDSDSALIPLKDYVSTFFEKPENQIFQLPPIQRNSVWNVAQIERLWDSILRGFPIGSLLAAPRYKNDISRDFISGTQYNSEYDGYFLMDGQQRTRSILLGFRPSKNARLWIDLNPNLNFGSMEFNDRKFLFRVITSHQPWGMRSNNPSEKLNEQVKFEARKTILGEGKHYDYQIEINRCLGEPNKSSDPFPLNSSLPVPFDLLIEKCQKSDGTFQIPGWSEMFELVPEQRRNNFPEEQPLHFMKIITALQKILDAGNPQIKTRNVTLLYQDKTSEDETENGQDVMEVLFRRVNSGGTILQGEEMAYSLLKSTWNEAYELVNEIIEDKEVEYLMPPTKIVASATRLARFIQNQNDTPNFSINQFRKWLGENETESKNFIEIMEALLVKPDQRIAVFHQVMRSFCRLTLHRGGNDIGLPKKLLLSINNFNYHPVFIWIYQNLDKDIDTTENRVEIIRYLIFCLLTVDSHDKASIEAIKVIKGSPSKTFPGKAIYNKLIETNELAVQLPSVSEFNKPFYPSNPNVDGLLRSHNQLFNIENDSHNTFRQWFWQNSRVILLWHQREEMEKWFTGYNPASNDAYDTPFDWDHIMPKSLLIYSGGTPEFCIENKEQALQFDHRRSLYVNSIGNYRMWPYWANRLDQDTCQSKKLKLLPDSTFVDNVSLELELKSKEDYLHASKIPIDDEALWLNAGALNFHRRKWTEERRISWQKAVESRVCHLYAQLYNGLNYNTWNKLQLPGLQTVNGEIT